MKNSGFFIFTVFIGLFVHFFCQRYLSISNAAPDVLLLLTAAHGFAAGPVIGQWLGFIWGLIADATGTELFGVSSFTLALVGFLAGTFRRRVASERVTAQLVIGLVATLTHSLINRTMLSIFEGVKRGSNTELIIETIMNVIFIPIVFIIVERWLTIWNIEREHM